MNMKYQLYMSTKKLTRMMIFLWVVAFSFALICLMVRLLNHRNTSLHLLLYTISGLDVIIFVLAVITYAYFYLKVKRIKRSARDNDRLPQQELSLAWKKFRLPCYISITYIAFNLTAALVIAKAYNHKHDENDHKEYKKLMYIAVVLDLTGFFSDNIIYLFMNKNVRQLLTTCRLRISQTEPRTLKFKNVKYLNWPPFFNVIRKKRYFWNTQDLNICLLS